MNFVTDLPEWAVSCDSLNDKAEGYVIFLMGGARYHVPLTSEMKALFGITRRGDKLIFKVEKNRRRFETVMRDMAGALLLQVRDTVGEDISANLSEQLTNFLDTRLGPGFDKMVSDRLNQKVLIAKGSETNAS